MSTITATADINHNVAHLYESYHSSILRYLVNVIGEQETAEDLCQETFVKALRSWAEHAPETNEAGWLYRIATNTAYDYLRRRRRIRFTSLLDSDRASGEAHTIEARVDDETHVRAALAQIPPHYRLPLVLQACGGHSMQEIANVLGCSSSAVKMRLFRARERFREVYQE